VGIGQENDKLISADAHDDPLFTAGLQEDFRKFPDELVSGFMTENIIRQFQHIDVRINDRQGQVARNIHAVAVLFKISSVEQPRKRVMIVLITDCFLFFLALADIQKGDHPAGDIPGNHLGKGTVFNGKGDPVAQIAQYFSAVLVAEDIQPAKNQGTDANDGDQHWR